jgi:type IV pilus assembly protein PilA
MLHKIRERAQSDKGFTLIELLVVILIIGILAAIALPAFLGQRQKAQDSSAKSDARNMVSQLESFYVDSETYAAGPGATGYAGPPTGLDIGSADGQVETTTAVADKFVVVAHSKSGNDFTITKDSSAAAAAADKGVARRTCTAGGTAGCPTGGKW